MSFTVECEVEFSEAQKRFREAAVSKQNTTTNQNMEAIRLSVEVVCLMRRFGYIVKDDTVLELIELCSKVAATK
jgi:hypothetical protein